MTDSIFGFFGEYRWLSNFYPAEVEWDGELYPTVEHAYQAAKTIDLADRMLIRAAATPGQAKRLGQTVTRIPDFDYKRVAVMYSLVDQKFRRHPNLRQALLATGDRDLVEDNYWGDRFWGVSGGVGENHLGRILVQVRAALRAENAVRFSGFPAVEGTRVTP